jgi:hypothetical protein
MHSTPSPLTTLPRFGNPARSKAGTGGSAWRDPPEIVALPYGNRCAQLGGGARLAGRRFDGRHAGAVETLESDQVAGVVHDRDADLELFGSMRTSRDGVVNHAINHLKSLTK